MDDSGVPGGSPEKVEHGKSVSLKRDARAERLKKSLRENLRRRKQKARALGSAAGKEREHHS